jgi:protocatechuate 3,4-dioxygenase beta subunit
MPNKKATTEKIADILKKTGSISIMEIPLHDIPDILAANYGCNIQMDYRGLADAGVTCDTRCTIAVKDVSLDSVLRQLLTEHGLEYVVRDEVILITAPEKPDSDGPKADDPPGNTSEKKPEGEKNLAEALTYTGQVTDKLTGKPIAGATVTVRRQIVAPYEHRIIEEPTYTTDAVGKYTFTIPPEQVADRLMYIELDVSHPDYATRKGFGYSLTMIRKNEKIGERPFFEHVELYPAEPITGMVVTPEGSPAAGIKVLGFSMPDRNNFESASFSDATTDAQGAFRLNLAKGSKAIFWLLPKDYAPSAHVVDEKRGDLGRFELEKGTALTGRVVDEQDKPVADVWINAEITGGPAKKSTELPVADFLVRSALTDAKGEFTLSPLPVGECLVRIDEYPRDHLLGRQTRRPPPGVFGPKRLSLKAGDATASVGIRGVPQVVIEGQFYDSRGKPRLGHEPMLCGRIDVEASADEEQSWVKSLSKLWGGADQKDRNDQGTFYFTNGTMDKNGHFVIRAPKGLKEAKLDLMTNEHGALRVRMAEDGPLSNQCRDMDLGTLDRDIQGVEVVRYDAPILLVKPVAEDGSLLRDAKVRIEYAEGRGPWKGKGRFVEGTDVSYEKQEDGCRRTSQLLPDEEFTVTVEAEGYESQSAPLKLREGEVKELEVRLRKKL